MKWFWLTFFSFLTILVMALGVWKPETLETAVHFLGWWFMALLGVVLLSIVGGMSLIGWMYWQKNRLLSLKQKDGAFPLQRIKLKGGATLYYDPNHSMSPATIIHPEHGLIEVAPQAGWDRQLAVRLAVERTRQLEAMYPGDDARTNQHGAKSDVPRLPSWKVFDNEPKRIQAAPAEIDVTPTMVESVPSQYSVRDGLMQNTRTKYVLGQTERAEIVRWDITESPHIRVHGKSQGAGKTNLIRCVAASALRVGCHVVICDRRRFKDWAEFTGKAELIDVRDPKRFVAVAQNLAAIYQERDRILGEAGAPNIAKLPDPPQRIVVVIAEFGALCAQAAADGVLEDMLHPLTMVLREAGAAGVHVVIEDQVVDQRWPRGISTNAEPVTGYLPQNYGAAGGYYDAHKLPAYTFHYGGTVFKSFDMRHEMTEALRAVRAAGVVVGVQRSTVPSTVHGESSPEVERQNGSRNVPVGTASDVDEPGRWDDVVAAWFSANPQALTGPALGISDLARAMCRDAEGDIANYEAYKGRAHKLFHEFRNAVRLPDGGRIGTDISYTEATR